YSAPAGATPTRNGSRARSRSTTLMGRPLCSDATLQASTATLIGPSRPSAVALRRYSEAGLLRPVGLKPPWRRSCRTASRTASSLRSGAAASRLRRAASSGGDGVSPSVRGKRVTNARRARRGWGGTVIMVLLYGGGLGRRQT